MALQSAEKALFDHLAILIAAESILGASLRPLFGQSLHALR